MVGSSVEFDDLHGVTVMGVDRRFDLTRSSRSPLSNAASDLLGASLGLLAISPLLLLIAIAIKLDSRGRCCSASSASAVTATALG